MSEYEDEDSRTIFCANLSDKVTEALLFELFLQGGPLEKVSLPKDKDGHQRSFGFITYVHAVSVPYAVSLFQGTRLFNRELTIKPRNNNSNTQQRPIVPVIQPQLLQDIQNSFVSNPFLTNDINRNHTQQHPNFANRQSIEPSSLRSGFNQISTKASMIPQPLNRSNHQLHPNSIASIASLLSMGDNMLHSNSRPSFDIRHADRDRSSNFKATQRSNNRSRLHHQDLPYKRRGSSSPRRDVTSRRQHGSGNDRHHGNGSDRHHGSGSDRRRR